MATAPLVARAVTDRRRAAVGGGQGCVRRNHACARRDPYRSTHGVLASVAAQMSGPPGLRVELLLPLFGGVRATVTLYTARV